MIKTVKVMTIAAMLAFIPAQAQAGDYEVANVMDDAFYGAGLGAMVGLGLMLLSDKPTNNWNYLTRGVGVGIIAGAAFGVYRTSKSFAQIDNGEIEFGVPTPQLAFQETQTGLDMMLTTDLVQASF